MRAVLVAAALAGGLVLPHAQAGPPHAAWLGTWALSVEQSRYGPGDAPYRRGTLTIEPWDGGTRMVYDLVGVRGGITHLEWTGTLDGQDYPLQGVEEFITFAYTRVDEYTYTVVSKVDLATVATSTMTLSPDGRTITTTTTGKSPRGADVITIEVYEKR